MSNLKKLNLVLLLLITLQVFSNNNPSKNTSFYISGNYEELGVEINYSAVIKAFITDDFDDQKYVALQLSSFFIEDAKYNDRVYRDNDIFGISFPIDTAVEITTEIEFMHQGKIHNKTIVLLPNKRTILNLNTSTIDFYNSQLTHKKTLEIKALHKHETFIEDIKKAIKEINSRKDSEAIEQEHTRLMILGNNYLNENNYEQAVATYQHAKKFTTDISYAESQIFTTTKYAERYNVVIDTEYKVHTTVSKDYYTTKQPSIFNNKEEVKTNDNKGVQNKYQKIKGYSTDVRSNEPVYAVNDDDPNADEYEYEYETKTPLVMTTIFDEQDAEYEYETENSQNTTSNDLVNEYEAEYETEDGKPIRYQNTVTTVSNLKKITNNSSNIKVNKSPQNTGIKKIITDKLETTVDIQKPSNENYDVVTTKKGYIKYRKDEQAVVDRQGNILIPYGKHQILRFRAGFARIKIKDDVDIKNIVCSNKNEEYTWSARIYENPWKETVMDVNGRFVDKVIKKVEIYIVDNVNNIPNSELSPALLKKYEDPNPFKGTQQISAFNLWNRNNANKPSVIEKRAEIERLKKIAKNEAFQGAEECRKEVSKSFEEVYDYYEKMGYEIILKN